MFVSFAVVIVHCALLPYGKYSCIQGRKPEKQLKGKTGTLYTVVLLMTPSRIIIYKYCIV